MRIEAFRELVGNPESAVKWKAKRLLSKQEQRWQTQYGQGKGVRYRRETEV